MKTSICRASVLFLFMLFASSGSVAGQKKSNDQKGSVSVLNGNLLMNGQHPEGGKISNTKTPAASKFDPRRYDRQIQTLKKIARERTRAGSLHASMQKFRREHVTKRMAALQQRRKAKLFGKPTRFVQAPSQTPPSMGMRAARPMASNVQINGKSNDTIFVGDQLTLSFSFAPGNISALLNIYVDADNNGIVSDGDFLLEGSLLMLDNDDNDMNPADGVYRVQFSESDILNALVSTLIFEVDDYQSISTATVTVRQRPTSAIVLGAINPPMPFIVCIVAEGPGELFFFSDSLGKFSFYVDRQTNSRAALQLVDVEGVSNGYTPPAAKTISFISDTTLVNLNYSLATSFIKGYAKDQTGAAVKNARVETSGSSFYVIANTDSTGFYKVGVSPGQWYVYTEVPGTTAYMENGNSDHEVFVASNSTVEKDLPFTIANSSISGTVEANGSGVGGINVEASGVDSLFNYAVSAANGAYTLQVYKPSTGTELYYVGAESGVNGYYVLPSNANAISPGTTNVNFEIKKITGGLQGRITDVKTGSPISGASISASGSGNYKSTTSNDTGFYHVSLPDGNYYLTIEATPYYSYSSNVIVAGAIVTENFTLLRSGSISGSVQDEDGNSIVNAEVYATDSSGYSTWSEAYSDQQGKYVAGGLTTNKFKAVASANGYMIQWYKNAAAANGAAIISVTDGFDTPNINFVLSHGGSISGKVVDKLGRPVPGVEIVAYDTLFNYDSYVLTDDSGYYRATGLGTGKFYVEAFGDLYLEQWYNGATSYTNAAAVSVVINKDTPNINFILTLGSSIVGTVKDKNNAGISYAEVAVLDSAFNTIDYGEADQTGYYALSRLVPGQKLYLKASEYGYGTRWYNNVSTSDSATFIVLQSEEQRTGIDFILPLAGSISGLVLDDAGLPVQAYVEVTVQDSMGNYVAGASAGSQGNYSVPNLSSGKYYVATSAYDYVPQWFDHKTSQLLADKVTVTDGQNTPNINFSLHRIDAGDSVVVKIRLANLPDTLMFSQSYVADNNVDYWWGMRFDADGNINTGPNGCEIELALIHYKSPGDPAFQSTVVDGTYHELLAWDATNMGYWRHDDVSVRTDASDKNTLILTAPKWWTELSSISSTTRFYVYTSYLTEQGAYSDVTNVGNAGSVTDPSSDVPYAFIDVVSASWKEVVTAVPVVNNNAPLTFALRQNYPNPFNPSTTIAFELPSRSLVSLKIFDLLGREVSTIVSGELQAGTYTRQWNAATMSSGVYFYRLQAGSFIETKKLLLLK